MKVACRGPLATPSLRLASFLLAAISSSLLASDRPAAQTPASVVKAFYAYHLAHDMAFTAETVKERAAWLSPGLLDLIRKYFSQPSAADEAPEIDGDPFTDTQEYPKSFEVGKALVTGKAARVSVTFSGPGAEDHRSVTVELERVKAGWLIVDVQYETEGSLRTLLTEGQ